ncbi:MAG: hypothetical protein Q7P63_17465 [Verrucomicrobiota bacterium JB022]|nr:hypothetical protein [Verrucomicrobiota bacterium JB022]
MSADHQLDHDEIIEYQLVVTNRGTTEVKGLQPMIPVPESCVFTGYCDAPETVSVVDASGEAHVLMPLLENAEAANREAVLATKAVRWTVASLAPGQSLTLSAQVVFLPRHPSQVQLAQD